MRKAILLLIISLIALTEIYAQGKKHYDLEHLYRERPIYEVQIPRYLRQYDISDSTIKAEIPKGSKVRVIDSFFRERWEVLYQGERGWLNEGDLSFHKPGMKNENEISALDSSYRNQPFYFVTNETHLKEHMSHKSATFANVPKGVKVRVINSFFKDWWEVIYDNRRGNLRKTLLSYQEIRQTQSKTYSDVKPKSNSSINSIKYSKRLHQPTSLRENPNSKSKVILRFKGGNKVLVIDDSRKWWSKVIYQEKVGWVKKSLLRD